ncbi:MAG: excinuclease ABC subunit B, partial [Candidatus Omnitrophica bacterium]|nr:excinuclease ABC subunit B [Candidatus Omnitrophota bacterium]
MLCDICHKNHATVHLTEIVNEKIIEMHICQECAQSKAQSLNEQLHLSGFLGGLTENLDLKNKQKSEAKCSSCGFSYEQFKKEGRLNCSSCYQAFRQQLLPLLKKIHSSTRHVGKVPAAQDKSVSSEFELK